MAGKTFIAHVLLCLGWYCSHSRRIRVAVASHSRRCTSRKRYPCMYKKKIFLLYKTTTFFMYRKKICFLYKKKIFLLCKKIFCLYREKVVSLYKNNTFFMYEKTIFPLYKNKIVLIIAQEENLLVQKEVLFSSCTIVRSSSSCTRRICSILLQEDDLLRVQEEDVLPVQEHTSFSCTIT